MSVKLSVGLPRTLPPAGAYPSSSHSNISSTVEKNRSIRPRAAGLPLHRKDQPYLEIRADLFEVTGRKLLPWSVYNTSGMPQTFPAGIGQAASAAAQRCVEVPFDIDLQKAWKQSCLNHLFERFGKPLIIILGQKNNPPIVKRL